MHDMKRPLTAIAASAVLALAGGGTAWACGGSGSGDSSGTYPGSYPGSTTTDTTSTDGTSTTASTSRAGNRKDRTGRARTRHHHSRS